MRWLYLIILLYAYHNSIAADPDCEALIYNTDIKASKNKKIEEVEVLLQVNNRSGEKFTKVAISYSKSDKLTVIEAKIEDMAGKTIRKLKNSDMEDVSAISSYSLYEDDFVKKFEMRHNIYPYKVYYKYRIEYSDYLYIARWSPVIDTKIPTRNATLSLSIPTDFEINFSEKNIPPNIKETMESSTKIIWKAEYDGSFKGEILAAPTFELLPHVDIVPVNFKYGVAGSQHSWLEFGNWISKINAGLNTLPEYEQKQVDFLLKDVKEPKEKTRILYQYLQDKTRYINVSLGIGGMKPYPASYVAANKYGDCKALTNFMKALLEYAGITSFYSIIYAGETPLSINKDLPSNQFNHVILLVPFEKDSVWLECTQQTIPFGYLGTFTQNREAFVVTENNSRFIKTPSLSPEEVKEVRNFHYNINSEEDCAIDINYVFKGEGFDRFNDLLTFYNKNDHEKIIRHYIPFSDFELKDWNLYKEDRHQKEIGMEMSVVAKNFLRNHSDEYVLEIIPLEIPNFEANGRRKYPVTFPYPINTTDSLFYHLPLHLTPTLLPEDKELISDFGKYSLTVYREGTIIKLIKTFSIVASEVPLEGYPLFKKWIDEVIKSENRIALILKKT